MNIKSAQEIGKKARAFKHCVSLINEIDKKGETVVKLNCTGVEMHVKKGDGFYLKLHTIVSNLREELAAMQVTMRSPSTPTLAPYGAAPTSEEVAEAERLRRRERQRVYNQRYYAKKKAERLANQQDS